MDPLPADRIDAATALRLRRRLAVLVKRPDDIARFARQSGIECDDPEAGYPPDTLWDEIIGRFEDRRGDIAPLLRSVLNQVAPDDAFLRELLGLGLPPSSVRIDKARLRREMVEHFKREEIETLCRDL